MPTFGPVFARRVDEPLALAKAELGAGRVREALAALEPQRLAAALRAGLDDVARAAGASRSTVEKLLDWTVIDQSLSALGESRGAAAMVWGELPPIAGGLLAGVAEVTTQAGNDDVGFYLDRLGHKMARDRSLAGPIDQLAADVEGWQKLMAEATQRLDEHPQLLGARRARAFLRTGIGLGVAAVIIPTGIALGLSWRAKVAARERVAVALDAVDPCAAEGIAAEDLAAAGAAAEARTNERLGACRTVRQRAALERACGELVTSVEAGEELTPASAEVAGDTRAILGRVAKRQLDPADLGAAPTWPCADFGAPPKLWKAYVDAASATITLWQDPPTIAPEVVTHLTEQGLSPVARGTLLSRAEEISGHGVRQGDASSLARGAVLCDLAQALKIDTGPNCRGLGVVRDKGARKKR